MRGGLSHIVKWEWFVMTIAASWGNLCVQWTLNSLRPSDAYMRQYNIPTLLQIMACRLSGTKPLSEPVLPYCHLTLRNIFQWNLFKIRRFSFKEMHLKMLSAKWRPFCLGLNVLHVWMELFWYQWCIFLSQIRYQCGRILSQWYLSVYQPIGCVNSFMK